MLSICGINLIFSESYGNFFDWDFNPYETVSILETIGIDNCKKTFEDRAFQNLIKSKQEFDVLIVDLYLSTSLLYLSEYYNVPVLMYASFDVGYSINLLMGNPAPPSYIPNIFFQYPNDMTFLQRLQNSYLMLLMDIIFNFYSLPQHDKIVKDHFPDAPDISKYMYKGSVVLMNSDLSIMDSMPQTPGMVHIGGYHITKPNPLPEDLEKIINNAKHGVILFSLGTNLKSTQIPKKKKLQILDIFSRLKETIIWKWEDDNLPVNLSNVIVKKWLPQSDILGKIKVVS